MQANTQAYSPATQKHSPSWRNWVRACILKVFCPGAEGGEPPRPLYLQQADYICAHMPVRFDLFIGCGQQSLLIANLMASRLGRPVTEPLSLARKLVWRSAQTDDTVPVYENVLIIASAERTGEALRGVYPSLPKNASVWLVTVNGDDVSIPVSIEMEAIA